jgi:hypothetical protein
MVKGYKYNNSDNNTPIHPLPKGRGLLGGGYKK